MVQNKVTFNLKSYTKRVDEYHKWQEDILLFNEYFLDENFQFYWHKNRKLVNHFMCLLYAIHFLLLTLFNSVLLFRFFESEIVIYSHSFCCLGTSIIIQRKSIYCRFHVNWPNMVKKTKLNWHLLWILKHSSIL